MEGPFSEQLPRMQSDPNSGGTVTSQIPPLQCYQREDNAYHHPFLCLQNIVGVEREGEGAALS